MDINKANNNLRKEIYNSDDLLYCFNCGTCISGCPASNGNPPLLVRNLARMVVYGLEDELYEEDTPWTCVSCSLCEEMCPMDVKPFELILGIRKWQSLNDETRVPTSIVEIYKRGYTQSVGTNRELRESLGLPELQTLTKAPDQLTLFQDMLMKTPVVSGNDYMFKEE
jgi:heterodisulfide reductase subunit C2